MPVPPGSTPPRTRAVSALLLASVLLATLLLSAPSGAADSAEWLARMNTLSETMTRVFVNVLQTGHTRTPADDKALVADARALAELARSVHALTPGGAAAGGTRMAPDGDPSLALIAKLFVDDTTRTVAAIERGNIKRARDLAVGTAAFCMACHTRSDRLRALIPPPDPTPLARLAPLDRAELYVATHRFDAARRELDALLSNDRLAQDDPVAWRRAVTHALVLEVRSARSPVGALALVERILNGPVPAEQSWADADGWRRSLNAWKAEPATGALTPEAQFREARRLIEEAEAAPRVPGDRSADVLYLRATAALHDFLSTGQRGPIAARAFLLLGVSYRRLRDVDVWSLARLYDEACIHEAPHTDLAQECYQHLDADVRAEDVDRKGQLPKDVAAHLQELQAKAAP